MTALVLGDPQLWDLRFGVLRDAAVHAAKVLPEAARRAFPRTGFEVSGQSGLRFLLDPASASWAQHAARHPGQWTIESMERALVDELTTLADPMSWVEEVQWTDGPSFDAVDEVLGDSVVLVGAGEQGLGDEGERYASHYARRLYSGAAFVVYALAQSDHGRDVLAELEAPHLPGPMMTTAGEDSVSFSLAHKWLRAVDLRWLPGHAAGDLAATLIRLLPVYVPGTPDPADVHATVQSGLLDAGLGILQASA